MNGILNYRGAILSKYKTITAFSKAIGWSCSKAKRILSGTQSMNSDDIIAIANCIEIEDVDTFMLIFFGDLSTKWTNKNKTA